MLPSTFSAYFEVIREMTVWRNIRYRCVQFIDICEPKLVSLENSLSVVPIGNILSEEMSVYIDTYYVRRIDDVTDMLKKTTGV